MKYPCDLIRDLLPLYQDGVCSEESGLLLRSTCGSVPPAGHTRRALCEADGMFPVPG